MLHKFASLRIFTKEHEISKNDVVERGGKEEICGDDPAQDKNVKFYTLLRQRTLKMIPCRAESIWEYPPPRPKTMADDLTPLPPPPPLPFGPDLLGLRYPPDMCNNIIVHHRGRVHSPDEVQMVPLGDEFVVHLIGQLLQQGSDVSRIRQPIIFRPI